MKEITVTYQLNDEQIARLEKLAAETGKTVEYLFTGMMELGCWNDINAKLDFYEKHRR